MVTKIINISLPENEVKEIKKYAYSTGRKVSTLVLISLKRFIGEESKSGIFKMDDNRRAEHEI